MGRRAAVSMKTSVWVEVHIRTSSSTRQAAHSNVMLDRPIRLIRTKTSSRSSKTAGASYSTVIARITNSRAPCHIAVSPRWRWYSSRAWSK